RDENIITVTVEMMRDGPEETVVISEVMVIEVGQDQNGKPLTSLVVIPTDTPATVAAKQAKLPTSQRVFYQAMREALKTNGETSQPDVFAAPIQAVNQEAVRTRFYESYATEGETPQKQQDARQKAFRRALESAQRDAVKARVLDSGKTMLWFKPNEAAD